jgi:hypothetical protein
MPFLKPKIGENRDRGIGPGLYFTWHRPPYLHGKFGDLDDW